MGKQKVYGDLEVIGDITSQGVHLGAQTQVFDDEVLVKTIFGNIPSYWCSGNTDLTILSLGTSVTAIVEEAFSDCSGFTGTLTIPDSVTTIGQCAFYYCSGFTGSLTIPDSVTAIGEEAFYYCSGLTGSLTIPDSVTAIGEEAFYYCSGFTEVNCHVTKTIMNVNDCLSGTGVTTLHARSTDATWTAGTDTIGGKTLTVVKDL